MEFINNESKAHFLKLSPSKRIEWLRNYSLRMEKGESLREIQKLIFDMEMEERQYSAMEPRKFIDPSLFDVFITDVDEADFASIGDELGVVRLSNADPPGNFFPIEGIVYGSYRRVFVPLVVKKKNLMINLTFLLDTGSPCTYLREDSFAHLGYGKASPLHANVEINGIGLTVHLSHGHFSKVDLLGQDFLNSMKLQINYMTRKVFIETC